MPYPILHPAVLHSWMQMKVLIDGLIGEASNKHDQLDDNSLTVFGVIFK